MGAVFGSFANVLIYRVPRGASIVKPGSACPACGRNLSPLENLPLLSYFFLRGRCRSCREKISVRYPIVEILVGVLWVCTAVRIGPDPRLPAYLIFVTLLVALSLIDLEVRRLPNRILAPGAAAGLVLLGVAAVVAGQSNILTRGLVGALAYSVPMLALAIAVPAGMGMGDVKFAAYLGLHLGSIDLLHVVVGSFSGFFLGAVAGLVAVAVGKKGRKETIPFGPAMATGALVAFFWGHHIIRVWLG